MTLSFPEDIKYLGQKGVIRGQYTLDVLLKTITIIMLIASIITVHVEARIPIIITITISTINLIAEIHVSGNVNEKGTVQLHWQQLEL